MPHYKGDFAPTFMNEKRTIKELINGLECANNEGTKHDNDKNRLDLLPFDALLLVGEVLTFAAKTKYADRNWENGINYDRLFGAAQRHLYAWHIDKTPDPESGLSHLAHAACCILFLLAFESRGMDEFDNRPDYNKKEGSL